MITPFQLGYYMELAGISYSNSCPWSWDRLIFLKPNAYNLNYHAQWTNGCIAAFEELNQC